MNYESKRMRKKVVVSYFTVLTRYLPDELSKTVKTKS
jgi:hypothetical protein